MFSATIVVALLATGISVAQNPSSRGAKREQEACEEMAMQAETNPRASASAISNSEAIAFKMAMTEARAELASQVAAEITSFVRRRVEQYQVTAGAGSSYNTQKGDMHVSVSGNDNSARTISAMFEADSSETVQRVAQIISNTRPVCKNTYDRPDGSVQVYVCVEMGFTAQRQAYQQLEKDGILDVDVDGDGTNDVDFAEKEFLLELAKAREEYNAKRKEQE